MKINHYHFSTIGSTNTWAKQHAHGFDRQAITLVTADAQTAGRGRFNRRWVSPAKENIYATYCLSLDLHRLDIGNLPQVAAVSIAQVLMSLCFQPQLKWPNDVLISNKKVAGILSESVPFGKSRCLIIGIGLNINMRQKALSAIDRPATSLFAESHKTHDIAQVLALLTSQFSQNLSLFVRKGFQPFLSLYRSLLHVPSTPVQFNDNYSTHTGRILSINDDGSLNLLLANQVVQTFHAGEILP